MVFAASRSAPIAIRPKTEQRNPHLKPRNRAGSFPRRSEPDLTPNPLPASATAASLTISIYATRDLTSHCNVIVRQGDFCYILRADWGAERFLWEGPRASSGGQEPCSVGATSLAI